MEAYKNEVDLIKADLKSEVAARDDQIEAFKRTLQGMQQVKYRWCITMNLNFCMVE